VNGIVALMMKRSNLLGYDMRLVQRCECAALLVRAGASQHLRTTLPQLR
jgi:hypothetical protein